MCVNSIVFYYFFRIIIQYSPLSLFESCNTVFFCPKASFCWCIFHCITENFAIPFPRAIAALLQYLPIETFAAEFQLFRGFLVAAVSFTKKTELFRTTELLFQKTKFSFTADSGEEISYCISSETIGTFFWTHLLPLCFLFKWFMLFQFLLRKSKIQRVSVDFFETVYVTEFGEKNVVNFQHSAFCKMRNKVPENDCLFVFKLCLQVFNLI